MVLLVVWECHHGRARNNGIFSFATEVVDDVDGMIGHVSGRLIGKIWEAGLLWESGKKVLVVGDA